MGKTFRDTAREAVQNMKDLALEGDLTVKGDNTGVDVNLGQTAAYPQRIRMSETFSVFEATDPQNIEINKGGWNNVTIQGNVRAPDGFNTKASYGLSDSNGNTTNVWYDGGTARVNTLRNLASNSTLWVIRSKAGDPETATRESTVGLTRTDDAGKTEVVDYYNNGFHGSSGSSSSIGHDGDFPVSVGHGIRVQKRNGAVLREFTFDWYDGNNRTPGFRILSPDQTLGPSFWFEGGLPIAHSENTPLEIRELGEGNASGKIRCRNVPFADGLIQFDNTGPSISVVTNSFGITGATRQSAGVWRITLSQGASAPDVTPAVTPGLPIWESGSSRRESPQVSFEQDPDGDNPQEIELRFEVSDDAGNSTLVDPDIVSFKAAGLL